MLSNPAGSKSKQNPTLTLFYKPSGKKNSTTTSFKEKYTCNSDSSHQPNPNFSSRVISQCNPCHSSRQFKDPSHVLLEKCMRRNASRCCSIPLVTLTTNPPQIEELLYEARIPPPLLSLGTSYPRWVVVMIVQAALCSDYCGCCCCYYYLINTSHHHHTTMSPTCKGIPSHNFSHKLYSLY